MEVPALRASDLADAPPGEDSAAVRARVESARARQLERQGRPNALVAAGELERRCAPDAAARKLLRDAIARLSLSARSFHRVIKVARTIADLERRTELGRGDVAEALQYRPSAWNRAPA